MTYTTIFDSGDGSTISVRREDLYLIIRFESPVIPHPVFTYIPSIETDDLLSRLDRAVNAPAWTRANFIRVTPHNPRMSSYTMYRVDDEKWLHEDGRNITVEDLARFHVDITVLAW